MISISCPTVNNCFAVGAGGTIESTSNGGSTWSAETSGTALNLGSVSFPIGGNAGMAAGNTGTVVSDSCDGGSLLLDGPPTLTFAPLTLSAYNQTSTASLPLTLDDETGSLAGWNVSAYATSVKDGNGHTLSTPTVTSASVTSSAAACTPPTNSVTYPTATLGTSSADATTLFNAAAGTGSGAVNVGLTLSFAVPGNQHISGSSDPFSSTITVTIASGP